MRQITDTTEQKLIGNVDRAKKQAQATNTLLNMKKLARQIKLLNKWRCQLLIKTM